MMPEQIDGHGFHQVPDWVWDRRSGLKHFERSVLAFLYLKAGRDKLCIPSRSTIAENVGFSKKSVSRAIQRLQELTVVIEGTEIPMIRVEHRQRKNRPTSSQYHLPPIYRRNILKKNPDLMGTDRPHDGDTETPSNTELVGTDRPHDGDSQTPKININEIEAAAADSTDTDNTIVEDLEKLGLDHESALKLYLTYPEDRIRKQIRNYRIEKDNKKTLKNEDVGPGWLMKACEKDYTMRKPISRKTAAEDAVDNLPQEERDIITELHKWGWSVAVTCIWLNDYGLDALKEAMANIEAEEKDKNLMLTELRKIKREKV